MEIVLALLGAAALCFLHRLLFIRLIAPSQAGTLPVFAVVPAGGDGTGLEQTLRHLHWLRGEGLSRFTILVVDSGLTEEGRSAVAALQAKDATLLFCPAEEATFILQRRADHGYFSL